MTNRRGKTTAAVPSRLNITLDALTSVTLIGVTVWMFAGGELTDREVAGTAAVALWAGYLGARTVNGAIRRHEAQPRRGRQPDGWLDHTGVWREDGAPGMFTVRWRPGDGYHVQGFMGEGMHFPREQRWADWRMLAEVIGELEAEGWEPVRSVGMEQIRILLGLPGEEPSRVAVDLGDVRPLPSPRPGIEGWNNTRSHPGPY